MPEAVPQLPGRGATVNSEEVDMGWNPFSGPWGAFVCGAVFGAWIVVIVMGFALVRAYKAGAKEGRKSPFAPDSICAACGQPERLHNSCPSLVAQKR